jgi:hypothetical protein
VEGNSKRGQGSRGTLAPVVVVVVVVIVAVEEVEEEKDLSTFLDGLNKTTINLNQGIGCSGRSSAQATPEYQLVALPHERNK